MDTKTEELILNWLEIQYFWTNTLEKRPVDFIYSKAFNTVDFYLTEYEDEFWYKDYCKEKYKEWCEENFEKLKEEDTKDKVKEKTWEEYFEKREIYPIFVTELFVTTKMLEEVISEKNPKKIKREFR